MNSYEQFALWSGGAAEKQRKTRAGNIVQLLSHERQALGVKVNIQTEEPASSVEIVRTGKNLLNYPVWKTIGAVRCTTVYENNGVTMTATGNDAYTAYNPSVVPETLYFPVIPGATLTLSWESDSDAEGWIYVFGDNRVIGSVNNSRGKSVSVIIPEGVTKIMWRMGIKTAGDTIDYRNMQLEYSNAPTAFEPYERNMYTVQIPDPPGSVTDGTLDVTGGKLTAGGQEYQTTPQEITARIGITTLWADAGTMEVTYEQ